MVCFRPPKASGTVDHRHHHHHHHRDDHHRDHHHRDDHHHHDDEEYNGEHQSRAMTSAVPPQTLRSRSPGVPSIAYHWEDGAIARTKAAGRRRSHTPNGTSRCSTPGTPNSRLQSPHTPSSPGSKSNRGKKGVGKQVVKKKFNYEKAIEDVKVLTFVMSLSPLSSSALPLEGTTNLSVNPRQCVTQDIDQIVINTLA